MKIERQNCLRYVLLICALIIGLMTMACTGNSDGDSVVDGADGTNPPAEIIPDTTRPTIPANLTAVAVSEYKIALSWDASTDDTGVTGYEIYRDGIYLKSVDTTTTSDFGLIPSTEYCYTLYAYDAAVNKSDKSVEVCATTLVDDTNYVPGGGQYEITEPSDVLDENGALIQTGWARKPLLRFNPENLGVGWERAKYWDFYGIINHDFHITFFIADLGYLTLITVTFTDTQTGETFATGGVKLFTKGELGLSNSSMQGDFEINDLLAGTISIKRQPDRHILYFNSPLLKGLEGEVELGIDPSKDSTVVATSYEEDPHFFYYNHKFNLLPATGSITFDGKTYDLTPDDSYGQFDWGRGVWPYETHWFWGTGAGIVDGHEVHFNIGYGFGDLSTHTENMIFYDGKCHKIDQVTFHTQEKKSGKAWTFTSNDDRLELTLTPIADQSMDFNVGIGMADSNQIIGHYSGYLILDDGTRIEIENMAGHAEDIRYRW